MTASNNSVLLGVGIGYGGFVIVPLHPFDGKMDDVRIWERALTAEEMGTLKYQGGFDRNLGDGFGPTTRWGRGPPWFRKSTAPPWTVL